KEIYLVLIKDQEDVSNKVEYAIDAIKLGLTAIGLKTKEGVVLAVGNHITSPLLVKQFAEMSRKRCFFKDQIPKAGLISSGIPTVQPDVELEALEVWRYDSK
nr:proteasome subunit alpha type-5 isoform X2 [Tanacetum cinerariifolium]